MRIRLLKGKKGFSYLDDWAELFFFILLFTGLIFGTLSPSAIITYFIAILLGFMAGRLMFFRKGTLKAPYLLIIIGFVIGYVIGTFHGDKRISFLLFIVGAIVSYRLYAKGIIKDILY
ncbi:hypothetical protein GOV09_00800 [Candidatus Woesearchaeota archaeon]|nr:hypothetical protein [Candidatus Woesearchaeota archaeon]